MVVLAVTWMAKVGHEAEVAALFEKLTEQSRKEPGCAMYQVHRHKTGTPPFLHLRAVQGRCCTRGPPRRRALPATREERVAKGCRPGRRPSVRAAGIGGVARGPSPAFRRLSLHLVDHQFAARRVTLLRDLVEGHDDRFPPRPSFFDQSVRDPLGDLALLICGTAVQQRDLNNGHKESLSRQLPVLSRSFSTT